MEIFQYGSKEIEYLKKKDKRLGEAIDRIGIIQREVIPDLFTALINSIAGQQISGKAAVTVWNRLKELLGEITPEKIYRTSSEDIQKCGMSMRKANYIKNAADEVLSGRLNVDELLKESDEEVCKRLCMLNGIGVWTAEMLMIFSMRRPDVVSFGDFGIRKGMMLLYHHKEIDKVRFERYKKRYSPYGTVASFYLWEIAAGK